MTPEFAVEMIKQLVFQAVTLAAPLLLAAMVVGLTVSIFQSVTSINEQTLSFVPKALLVLALLVVMLPWMLRTLVEFTRAVMETLPQMTG